MEHYKAGRYIEAVSAYEEAVAAKPDYAPCYVNLTLALLKRNRPDDAVRAAQQAVKLAPQAGAAHYHLGNALSAKNRWNEAVTEYVRAFELDQTQLNGLVAAGHLLMDHGLTPKALETWNLFLATAAPNHPRRAEVEGEIGRAQGGPGLISKF
jgi:tetratricopeptide (TPR) repeat protein